MTSIDQPAVDAPLTSRETLTEFLGRLSAGDLDGVGALLADSVDWEIAGAAHVPWAGRRTTPAAVTETLATLGAALTPQEFAVSAVLADGPNAVALGRFTQRVNATGATFASDFAIHLTVVDGKITRYRIHEDSYAVAQGMAEV